MWGAAWCKRELRGCKGVVGGPPGVGLFISVGTLSVTPWNEDEVWTDGRARRRCLPPNRGAWEGGCTPKRPPGGQLAASACMRSTQQQPALPTPRPVTSACRAGAACASLCVSWPRVMHAPVLQPAGRRLSCHHACVCFSVVAAQLPSPSRQSRVIATTHMVHTHTHARPVNRPVITHSRRPALAATPPTGQHSSLPELLMPPHTPASHQVPAAHPMDSTGFDA